MTLNRPTSRGKEAGQDCGIVDGVFEAVLDDGEPERFLEATLAEPVFNGTRRQFDNRYCAGSPIGVVRPGRGKGYGAAVRQWRRVQSGPRASLLRHEGCSRTAAIPTSPLGGLSDPQQGTLGPFPAADQGHFFGIRGAYPLACAASGL